MESLYILIPIAIVFVCIAIGIFLWAVKSEQFDDLERRGYDILFDEDDTKHKNTVSNSELIEKKPSNDQDSNNG
ncbi:MULTISPECIES: cbb3-type cytochrome oxidase assembly protein CcoS [unclassified Photobacterium]|uniref:cbb3-type cytochrome oxidase assembly protein CcoS n=1 Tax=unclassified Photobacterium TaxID=2628852 RepID=UPI000D15B7C7|nr:MULTISPECIES: cbb3-type cytochrome oxidase assembly protein CcoS [unclassified Photobacterium]PSV27478.1 cbb3-type cytochrome oxidase assembly protein CcoS [Photobacterium sp. GB-56]PSV31257.1 cbb3-type cytochrome oxidase assembly protein CcoS [Photobacterium sp. GB-72]PSV34900.1 cbb3-type cytochrome oxidase assembly protein CcoS [Photobacterium sp. GB-210]PSV44653.1 cbb3-type cytochrome oxidase assembly protein CcoS [Photobacterium sp. GB-36]PSV57175.1 cbb3-type cytochrome oxidase assembly